MKTNFFCFFLLFSTILFGQENEKSGQFKNYSSTLFNSTDNALNVISAMNTKASADFSGTSSNSVLIQQIGNNNQTFTNVNAKNVEVSVNQTGTGNNLMISKEANSVRQNIAQQGRNNFITDYSSFTYNAINMEIVQNGDNQSVQNFGTNSLSKDMKIIQTGTGSSVVIFNKN
ncbi:hypothetical protein [Flavobacterium sp.]|jgi:hypothetical protein|uniref:hypothetical protein n=1 Tax=Flavobacterium sp. TaxID=239 RepID=UPI0022C1E91C|nr:hypothetical protein [Flavobacterium sp.]MCZ8228222.1 hypothetical protein [Flavobacterium sp.]